MQTGLFVGVGDPDLFDLGTLAVQHLGHRQQLSQAVDGSEALACGTQHPILTDEGQRSEDGNGHQQQRTGQRKGTSKGHGTPGLGK